MNILYLLPFWPHTYASYLFRDIAAMKARGHGVAVASLRYWPGGEANVVNFGLTDVPVLQIHRKYESDARLVRDVGSLALSGLRTSTAAGLRGAVRQRGVRHGLHSWATMKRLIAFAREHRCDVIDAHWASEAAEMARALHAETGLPYAVTMHGGDIYRASSPDLPGIVKHASALLPVSGFLRTVLLNKGVAEGLEFDPARVRVRHHGLPADAIAERPAVQLDGLQLVGIAGRLDPEKRQMDLIEAAAPLAEEFPNLRLRIIGGGVLHKKLEARAAELGLVTRCEVTGVQPWHEVVRLMRELHVYVQASEMEGYGLTTLEGAAQGVPVIATRTGAHEEIVEHGATGFTYPPGDVAALREHLRALLADREARARMGYASLLRVRERFLIDRLIDRTESLLRAVRDKQPLPE